MKKIWQEFKSFIKMISKGKKDVAVVMAAGGFMKASIPFLVFYFSAQIKLGQLNKEPLSPRHSFQ